MVHGEIVILISHCNYYREVFEDIDEVKKQYPFTNVVLLPTVNPKEIELHVVAVNVEIINTTKAEVNDFLGEYSKEIRVVVPFDYKRSGCKVYGGQWIDLSKLRKKDLHFHDVNEKGELLFCVGTPASFLLMDNVILENIRTAEKMLVAYERYMCSRTAKLELIAYSHGKEGIEEYEKDKKRYSSQKRL